MSNNNGPNGGDILAGFLLTGLVVYGVASAVKFVLGIASIPQTEMETVPAAETPIPSPETMQEQITMSTVAPTPESSDSDDYDPSACRWCGGHNFCPCGNCITCVGGNMNYCSSCAD